MNKVGCAAMVAATAALAAFSAQAALKAAKITEVYRPYTPSTNKAEQLSGITYVGGDSYYAVDDVDDKMYPIAIHINRATGAITRDDIEIGVGISLADSDDLEGCAFDPASGNVWVSQETYARIREFDPATGALLRTAPVPAIMRKYHNLSGDTYSLEALTISGDGLTMWTCNEEALTCDGELSAKDTGSVVRLTKFTRESVYGNWTVSLQWAYLTDKIGTNAWYYNGKKKGRSGVASLVALPDGNLLVLERDLWGDNSWDSTFYNRIYLVDGTGVGGGVPTNVLDMPSLRDATYKRAKKTSIFNQHVGWVNYEGMCLGPRLDDGSVVLVLVSDGGNCTEKIMTMKLYDDTNPANIDIRTLNVNTPASIGTPSFAGQNYRFLSGTTITNKLLGEGVAQKPYTNWGDLIFASSWKLTKPDNTIITQGDGPQAEFNITSDATLTWTVSQTPSVVTSSPYYAHDTFEDYAHGTPIAGHNRWTGEGEVIAHTYTPPQGQYIFKRVDHKKVLDAEDEVTKSISPKMSTTRKNRRVDVMVEVHRSPEALQAPTGDPVVAIAADKDGYLNVWHRGGYYGSVTAPHWSKLSNTKFTNGTWVRVGMELYFPQSGRGFAHVRLNGGDWSPVPGGNTTQAVRSGNGNGDWFPLSESASAPSYLTCVGTKVDDLVVATPTYIAEIDASASIMVAPVASSSGANGAAVAEGQAYTVTTAVPAPAAAAANVDKQMTAPVITGFGIAPGGCPSIRFKGYAEGVGYRVVRSSSVEFKSGSCEYPDGQFATDGCKAGEAVWVGSEPDDPASGAKFYRIEAVEMQ